MSTTLTIDYCGTYLHVRLGENYEITPESTEAFWRELAIACERHQCWRVLSEGHVAARRMSTMNAFDSGTQLARFAMGVSLACCFYGYQPDDTTTFFKDVAYNRGVRVEFFTNREHALRWLGVEGADRQMSGSA